MSRLVRPPAAIDYPRSDGKPLAENDAQLHALLYAVGALGLHFAERSDVYVSGDLPIYYEEGNPRVSVAPDAFVVFGVEDRVRMNYKVWEEGKGPDFVLEVASPSTWREDVERKPAVYAGLGVREYFLFRPVRRAPFAVAAGLSAGGRRVRAAGGGGVDRPHARASKRGAGAGSASEARGRDALPRPGNGRGSSQPRRGRHRAPRGRGSGRAGSCRPPGGNRRAPGCRGAGRGARGASAGQSQRPMR